MDFVIDRIKEILSKNVPECPIVEYKLFPYKIEDKHEFVKDVLAMLNTKAGLNEDKFIIIGVENKTLIKKGISKEQMLDDTIWQDQVKSISPRPLIETGTLDFEGLEFGYVYISGNNVAWPYESKKTVIGDKTAELKEKNAIFMGQSFIRYGSAKEVLSQKDREELVHARENHIRIEDIFLEPPEDERLLVWLALIGSWNENNDHDLKIIENVADCPYSVVKSKIIRLLNEQKKPISYSNGIWSLKRHDDLLQTIATHIVNSDFDLLVETAKQVLINNNAYCSFYESPDYGRLILNKGCDYSEQLLQGISESLAIISNNFESFENCDRRNIRNSVVDIVRNIICAPRWELFFALEKVLITVSEINPSVYISAISNQLKDETSSLSRYMELNNPSDAFLRHGEWLKYSLSSLAQDASLFSQSVELLISLSEYHDSFSESVLYLILPWYPQTNASSKARTNVFEGMEGKYDDLIWSILTKCLPGMTLSSFPISKTKYFSIEEPKKATNKSYAEDSKALINLSLKRMNGNPQRMCDMLKIISNVDFPLQNTIQNTILDNSSNMVESDKEKVWNNVQDIIIHHKKFPDADWGLDDNRLESLSSFASKLLPDSSLAMTRRLFRNDQYGLLESIESFHDEQEKLHGVQVKLLKEMYDNHGFGSVLSFSKSVENNTVIGRCLADFIRINDITENLASIFHNDDLATGLFRYLNEPLFYEILDFLNEDEKVKVISKRDFNPEILKVVFDLSQDNQKRYWQELLFPYVEADAPEEVLNTVIYSLNSVGRCKSSIELLANRIYRNDLSQNMISTIIETLSVFPINEMDNSNEYHINSLIAWLQENAPNNKQLLRIEWKFLTILKEYNGHLPVALHNKMASDPDFFVALVNGSFDKNGFLKELQTIKEQTKTEVYGLLYSWKTIPGSKANGEIDFEELHNWIDNVSRISKEFDLYDYSMELLGHTFFYSPKDEDFFIKKGIAKIIHEDASGSIGAGYVNEAFNSRGVHYVDETGEADFTLAKQYDDKAMAADENGFIHFATDLRQIASMFRECGYENQEDAKLLNR